MENNITCSRCGRLFTPSGFTSLCIDCLKQDMETFDRIREYLYENPCAHMFDVATNTHVSINTIKKYLREGRLEIVEDNNQFLKCIKCGTPIKAGNYCDACSSKANHDFKTLFKGKQANYFKPGLNYLTSSKS